MGSKSVPILFHAIFGGDGPQNPALTTKTLILLEGNREP